MGFLTMMGGNACWVVVGLMTQSLAMVLANLLFFALNARGWRRWTAEP
jgi:hypothetical protein